MIPSEITSSIFSYIAKVGYIGKIVSAEHLKELEDELTLRKRTDKFDENFYQERLTSFKYTPTKGLTYARSIIVIAVPQPVVVLIFRWHGEDCSVYIPPTYDNSINEDVKEELEVILAPEDYHIEPTVLPLKLLAVRSGLAQYGRNNICYISGKGSFYRLIAFFSDLPCPEDSWRPFCMMERCDSCGACIMACPTGAIDEKRFLLHAELCLSFHNEHTGDFPKDINPHVHHCLFGCLICQNICPENKKNAIWLEERESFFEYETSLILNGIPLHQIPNSTRLKLDRLCLTDNYSLLARNLNVLLK